MVTTAAKRKKTADMPDSPPKRATRARAKATDEVEAKSKTTKITTASTKVAAGKKKAAVPARASKRKTKADDENMNMNEEPAAIEHPRANPPKADTEMTKKIAVPARASKRKARTDEEEYEAVEGPAAAGQARGIEQPKAEPPKTKGREKKPVASAKEDSHAPEAPKTRGRKPRAALIKEHTTVAPKTAKGRPRKEADQISAELVAPGQTEEIIPEGIKKSTRGRAAAIISKPLAATVPKSTAAATKKRVKFQEEPDKENIPIKTVATKKSAITSTGIKAKPVRKPAATRGSTRGRKAIKEDPKIEDNEKNDSAPLSPKKINQVAKSDPLSSEDELAGDRTPMRALSRSPAKRPMSPIKDFGSVSRLNFNQQNAPLSPTKPMSSSILASPARRPPASPFKDALKSSPKKINLGDSIAQPALMSSRTPMKASLLQESPKKGIIGSSVNPTRISSQSPFPASLLQSPARKPVASPKRAFLGASPRKAGNVSRLPESPIESQLPVSKIPPPPDNEGIEAPAIADDIQRHPLTTSRTDDRIVETPTLEQALTDEPIFVNGGIEDSFLDSIAPEEGITGNTLPQEYSVIKAPTFSVASASLRRSTIESEVSEDELASPQKELRDTLITNFEASTKDSGTSIHMPELGKTSDANVLFSPLADKLSSWSASSPNRQIATSRYRQARGVFAIGDTHTIDCDEQVLFEIPAATPTKLSFFDDEMAVLHDQADPPADELLAEQTGDIATFQVSQESQASEEYGDENEAPNDPELLRAEQDAQHPMLTCTPAKIFTPMRAIAQQQRGFHTVSKVPLRASDDDPLPKVPRQRSRSFGGPLAVVHPSDESKDNGDQDWSNERPTTPVIKATAAPQTPSSCIKLDAETHGRTVRKGVVPDVLKGAVVYVDVHTSEGADASGIFVDLLTQMGARCVKQWSWNPRASIANFSEESASPHIPSSEVSASKVGVTHVVYKDGGKRTLEKVRASNGIVLCVGVGWVLDCEREDKWLDEADYAIDTSLVPRGGNRRRKSMEPRALANLNGNLIPASDATPAKSSVSPTTEFLTFNTPASRRETFIIEPHETRAQSRAQEELLAPEPSTPVSFANADYNIIEDGSAWGSPTTPYYLSKGAELVQRTCPPKQRGGLFPVSGEVDDQPDEAVRRRLIEARRKSLQWASRIRSPLGRTVSYGK